MRRSERRRKKKGKNTTVNVTFSWVCVYLGGALAPDRVGEYL